MNEGNGAGAGEVEGLVAVVSGNWVTIGRQKIKLKSLPGDLGRRCEVQEMGEGRQCPDRARSTWIRP